ncbi:MAG: glycosyltransferase family 2 protein [Nitrospirae bacterium]|nr:glycosyltransferase family 2 protein [Nitrospirota bacterium]
MSFCPVERFSLPVTLDIIISVYNEEEVLNYLIECLNQTFTIDNCKNHGVQKVTYIFVDDGSKDRSREILHEQFKGISQHISIKIICLSRNFGHQAAITAGISNSSSDLAAIVDADLQDPPELIISMIDKWREGYEVVYAVRRNRKENLIKRFCYWLFYRIYRLLSPIDVCPDSGDFCLMSNRIVKELNNLGESIRFPRGLRSWVGFKQTGISYDRPERKSGKTKYNFSKLYQLATDGITAMSLLPLKMAQLVCVVYLLLSLLIILVIMLNPDNFTGSDRKFYFLLVCMLFCNSTILGCLYILGAYVGRTYLETKRRPPFIIERIEEK